MLLALAIFNIEHLAVYGS